VNNAWMLFSVITAGYNSSREKEKLQNMMAFGSELEPTPPPRLSPPQLREEEEVDRFDESE